MTAGYTSPRLIREDWLERRVRALEQQVLELQAARGLAQGTVQGGSSRWLDTTGRPRRALGAVDLKLGTPLEGAAYMDATYGDGDTPGAIGSLLAGYREGDRGRAYPDRDLPIYDRNLLKNITSGTFTETWAIWCQHPEMEVLVVDCFAAADSGCVGEVRLIEALSGQTTSAVTISAGAVRHVVFEWLHPAWVGLYESRAGRDVLDGGVQLRRVSGAANVSMWQPTAWLSSQFLHGNADASGNGHITVP